MSTFNVHEWNRKRYLSEEVNEVKPQTDLIGIAAHTLKDMSAEEAIDAIDRLMLYLKDAKADIEYKDSGFNLNENMGFSKAEILKMKEDLSNFLDKYDYIMAPVDASKVYDATSILGRLTQHPKVK